MTTDDPNFNVLGALYFLEAGHYLFRYNTKGGKISKFVSHADVKGAFLGQDEDTGWLPAGVVRTGYGPKGRFYAYTAPAQKVTVTLLLQNDDLAVVTIPIPRTVLLARGKKYWIWAIAEKTFSRDAKAFHAPFPNVHEHGLICWGSNIPPEADPEQARKVWEMFFSTPFNNHLANNKSQSHATNVCTLLHSLDGKNKFPLGELIYFHNTIGQTIDRALESR